MNVNILVQLKFNSTRLLIVTLTLPVDAGKADSCVSTCSGTGAGLRAALGFDLEVLEAADMDQRHPPQKSLTYFDWQIDPLHLDVLLGQRKRSK